MSRIVDINKYVVDGEYAEKIYKILQESYFVEHGSQPFEGCCAELDFHYADGVLRVEEKMTGSRAYVSYIAEILYFFAHRDNIFCLSEHIEDDVVQSYDVNDSEGKYFVRPPMTEWELQMQEQRKRRSEQDELPF